MVLSGAIYIFASEDGHTWSEHQKIVASDGAANDQFGISVAVRDNTVIVGAWYDDDFGEKTGIHFDIFTVVCPYTR